MKIAKISSAVSSFDSKFALVLINFTRVGADFPAIGTQFLSTCALEPVLAVLTSVTAPVDYVAAYVTTINAKFPAIGTYLTPVRT
jgi:hypothetical protein